MAAARLSMLIGIALTLVACGESDKLYLTNASTRSVIVQPDQPLGKHSVWLLDPISVRGAPDDTYAVPGSAVRIFSEECEPITEFTLEKHSGIGETLYTFESDDHISISTGYNLMGESGPGARDHSPCPVT